MQQRPPRSPDRDPRVLLQRWWSRLVERLEALVWALESGEISGAGIDVYEREPKIHPGLLRFKERVVLAPHIGSATVETRRKMAKIAVDNVLSVLGGRGPLNPVS